MPTTRNRLLVRTTAPASEPLSLTEAKLYLRVDTTSEDSLIVDMIVAVRMSAEAYLRRSLITQSWKLAYDDFLPACVELPMGPVISVASVTIVLRDGTTQPVSNTTYYLNAAKDTLMMDTPLIPSAVNAGTRIEVIYSTGYGDASAVPKPIKQGMLAHLAHMYDNRGMPSADHDANGWDSLSMAMPLLTRLLYSAYRGIKL